MSRICLEMAFDLTEWISLTCFLIASCFTLLAIFLWYSYHKMIKFTETGIPGPRPWPVVGNILTLMREGVLQSMTRFKHTYGKIYCFFMMSTPTIVVNDLDMLKDIMVKKFATFTNKQPSNNVNYKPWIYFLMRLTDDHWKHVRSTLSPTFSSGKLKKMMPAIQRVCQSLADAAQMKAKIGDPVELKDFCGFYSMDVIAGAVFGLEVNSLHNPEEPFYKHGLAIMNFRPWVLSLYLLFPCLAPVFRRIGLSFVPQASQNFFLQVTETALKERRQDEKQYSDFLQLLIDAERDMEVQSEVDKEIDHGNQLQTSTQWTRKGLTQDEMQANAILFLLAGYDTVATALSFTLFCLAANHNCLKRVQEELDEKLGQKTVDYETVHQLTYLDMCMNEALRLYPPGPVVDRKTGGDVIVGGYHLVPGMRIFVPIYDIHTDPEIWPDPMKFDPERHTSEARANRHPFSFMPFGMGPRNCIGMRLAQLEIKMAVASVLQEVTPVLCEKSVYPPVLVKLGRMIAEDKLWVKFVPRQQQNSF